MAEYCTATTFDAEFRATGICPYFGVVQRGNQLVCSAHMEGPIKPCEGCLRRDDKCVCEVAHADQDV